MGLLWPPKRHRSEATSASTLTITNHASITAPQVRNPLPAEDRQLRLPEDGCAGNH